GKRRSEGRSWPARAQEMLIMPSLACSRRNAMLVLMRRIGEKVVVNGDIGITVIGIKGDRVRLAFDAPKEVTVDREEIHERRLEFQQRSGCEERSVCK